MTPLPESTAQANVKQINTTQVRNAGNQQDLNLNLTMRLKVSLTTGPLNVTSSIHSFINSSWKIHHGDVFIEQNAAEFSFMHLQYCKL